MNKNNLLLVIAVALIAGGLVLAGSWFNQKTIVVDNQGRPVGAVSNIFDVGPELGINGLQMGVVSGDFTHNGTSTIADFRNPFPATATIDLFTIRNVGVSSSTYNFECGPTTSSTTNAFAQTLLSVGTVATSTNFGVVTNLMATSSANRFGSMTAEVGFGQRINIGAAGSASDRFKCIATHPGGYDTQRIATTTPNATFQVKWRARLFYGQ